MIDDTDLFARFHSAFDVQPPLGAAQHLRAALLECHDLRPTDVFSWKDRHRNRLAAVVAVLIAVAIVATLLFVGHERKVVPVIPIPHRATSGATCDTQTSPPVPLKMLSPTTGWAHGAMRTTDGGLHWKDMSPPSLANRTLVYAECFLDSNHAWIAMPLPSAITEADHIVTFATADGGQTWQQSAPVPLGVRVCPRSNSCGGGLGVAPQLFFTNAYKGWLLLGLGWTDEFGVSVDYSVLYSTTDGGLHWILISSSGSVTDSPSKGPRTNSCRPIVLGVTFVSPTSGWGQTCDPGGPALLVTHDGGVTWQLQRLPSALDYAPLPVFFNDKQGILLGSVLLATSDAGITWVERSLPPRITSCCGNAVWRVFKVDFLDPNTGWAIAPPPGWTKATPVRDWLYRTSDGGQTWVLVQKDLPLGYPVISLLVIDANDAFAAQYQNATGGSPVGPGTELLKTTDGGRTWKAVP